MPSRNRNKKSELASLLGESVANQELSSFILDIFQISRQPRRIRKNRNHQKFLLMQRYLSKVICNSPSSPLI